MQTESLSLSSFGDDCLERQELESKDEYADLSKIADIAPV